MKKLFLLAVSILFFFDAFSQGIISDSSNDSRQGGQEAGWYASDFSGESESRSLLDFFAGSENWLEFRLRNALSHVGFTNEFPAAIAVSPSIQAVFNKESTFSEYAIIELFHYPVYKRGDRNNDFLSHGKIDITAYPILSGCNIFVIACY